MAKSRAIIEGEWLLFKTPDNHDVLVQADDIMTVWAGQDPSTIVIQRQSNAEPLAVRYPSVRAFAADFTDYYDERRRPRAVRKPGALKIKSLYGSASSHVAQTKKQ